MSEAERQLKIARQVIEVALDWIDRADQTIRRESGETSPTATQPVTESQVSKKDEK